ncbi:hypothetical protein SAMN05444280_12321 [Tangfeifania diversioriginum]|uniref:ABC-2 type transport system permease protein n=1 Tax=Tangfeifania diversioriginum TaxID=1168035 RepID=A0A1M6KF55_9BACT|nr:DUF5687 family protein [Tangfeifania diversioriginum]SHJ57497.1 hypothetical protein SAMN05444280_12321 [Tangfeifania diversioriginum]
MKRNFAFFAWREFTRSASFGKNMAAKGVLIFLAIYFSVSFLFLGFSLSMFLAEKFPDQSVVSAFNSMILIYAGTDLVIRIFIQNLPTFGFQPFLVLPVKKRRIARYMLNKSVFHFFNILPFFLVLPFMFTSAVKELSGISLLVWFSGLFFLILINHFLAIFLKWKTNEDDRLFYGFLILAVAIFALNYFGIVDFAGTFGNFFDWVIQNPVAVFLFPGTAALLYFLNEQYILNRFYPDELSKKKKQAAAHDFSWLARVGEYGRMLSLEVKMILRNKRPRTSAIMSVLFLLYGLLLYKDYGNEIPEIILVFGGMFMTGIFSMSYGQFFPAWHSRYYPLLMTQNVKMKEVLQSAFFLMAATNVVFYLLSLGYMFISPKVLYIHLAVMLYNVGVNSVVIFALGLNSRKSIDLDTRAMFNYQGMGATQWLIAFPILLGPMAVYGIMALVFGKIAAYFILGGLGLVGIILHPRFITYFTRQYLRKKHKMIAAYKNS